MVSSVESTMCSAAKRADCTLQCIKHSIANWSKEVIVLLILGIRAASAWVLCVVLGSTI